MVRLARLQHLAWESLSAQTDVLIVTLSLLSTMNARSGSGKTSDGHLPRKYGFACANCRKKKARCNGELPSCRRCRTNNEPCYFDKKPSLTHVLELEAKIRHFDSLIRCLRESDNVNRLRILEEYFGSSGDVNQINQFEEQNTPIVKAAQPSERETGESNDILEEITLDGCGHLCFYGATSLYHWKIDLEDQSTSNSQNRIGMSTGPEKSEARFFSDPPRYDIFSSSGNVIGDLNITASQLWSLLDTYWCFPHHLHLVLCRQVFMRDMATSGPFARPFVLYSVLSQATRYSNMSGAMHYGDQFANRALSLLPHEIRKGSSIPAIQGLLILSSRECACGRTSEGWIHSGIAFRMMWDLGIHIPVKKLSHLQSHFSKEELALRQQIFWSCYTWDKTMSLCLGRSPTIRTQMPAICPQDILDGEKAETEIWTPKFGISSAFKSGTWDQAKSNTRFSAHCELCIIVDDILSKLYTTPRSKTYLTIGFFQNMLARLRSWSENLEPTMYLRAGSPAVNCPPLHILLLNLQYHTTIILLCRPFFSVQQDSRALATEAAQNIDALLILHIRRYGFRIITFLESYTTFVASTVNILDLQTSNDPQAASARLSLNLEVLRNAGTTPSNKRAVETIERILKKGQDNFNTEAPSWNNKEDAHLANANGEYGTSPGGSVTSFTRDNGVTSNLLEESLWQNPNFNGLSPIDNSRSDQNDGLFFDLLDGNISPALEPGLSDIAFLNDLFVAPSEAKDRSSFMQQWGLSSQTR